MADAPTFRGYWAIKEVLDAMLPLVKFYRAFRPDVRTVTLPRKHYDLLRRWPKAAGVHGFLVTADAVLYDEFTLAFDRTPPRYAQKEQRA